MSWVDRAIERIETALVGVTDPILRRRMTVYRLRLSGYTIHWIAEELNISGGTAHADMQWCYQNLPPAYANADEFRFISIGQLEQQYQRVMTPRVVLETTETGETIERVELPSLVAEKVARELKAEQAKLLGAYKTVSVDDDGDTATYTVTVSKPRFEIEGTATEYDDPRELNLDG